MRKELVMTKKDGEDFWSFIKCWIYDHAYVEGGVKIRHDRQITGKYIVSPHRDWDCNINVKLNHKIPIVFRNLKNYKFTSYYSRTRQIQLQNKCHTKWT